MADCLSFGFTVIRTVRDRRLVRDSLRRLSDRHLADMGLERGDIDAYVALNCRYPAAPRASRKTFVPTLQGCG